MDSVRLPARLPNLNSFAKEFVRSIKEEGLNGMILIGEGSLRRAVEQLSQHCQREGESSGIGEQDYLTGVFSQRGSEVKCRERLGAMLSS